MASLRYNVNFLLFLLIVLFNGFVKVTGTVYPEPDNKTYSGCYGDYMDASCDVSRVILISDIEGGSKPSSSQCQDVATSTDQPECCVHASGDCLYPSIYTSGVDDTFHASCSGRGMCERQILSTINLDETVCNRTEYKVFSQYILMSYYCVEVSRIGNPCGTFSNEATNTPIYIQSHNYPNTATDGNSVCNCSIETDSETGTITIYTIHRELYSINGNCKQSLVFEDGDTNTTFTCDDNSNFTSSSHQTMTKYIRLLWTNTAGTDGGRFWVGFYAGNSKLTVNCPASPRQYTSIAAAATTVSTTTSTSNTETSEVTESVQPSSTPKRDYVNAFIAVVCVIGFLLSVIFIVVCIVCIRARNQVEDRDHKQIESTPEQVSEEKPEDGEISLRQEPKCDKSRKRQEVKTEDDQSIRNKRVKGEGNPITTTPKARTSRRNNPKDKQKSPRKKRKIHLTKGTTNNISTNVLKAQAKSKTPGHTRELRQSDTKDYIIPDATEDHKVPDTTKGLPTDRTLSSSDIKLSTLNEKSSNDKTDGPRGKKRRQNASVKRITRQESGLKRHNKRQTYTRNGRKAGVTSTNRVKHTPAVKAKRHDKYTNSTRTRIRRRRNNASSVATSKYESLLKIISGSAFRYQKVFRKGDILQRTPGSRSRTAHALHTRDEATRVDDSPISNGLVVPRNSPVLQNETEHIAD